LQRPMKLHGAVKFPLPTESYGGDNFQVRSLAKEHGTDFHIAAGIERATELRVGRIRAKREAFICKVLLVCHDK